MTGEGSIIIIMNDIIMIIVYKKQFSILLYIFMM